MGVDNYEVITGRILELLEAGVVPWHKPWKVAGPLASGVANLVTGRPYTGYANIMGLSVAPFDSPWWLTFAQAIEAGGAVRKGEKSPCGVFFYKTMVREEERADGTAKEKRIPFLRRWAVFNADQVDGLTVPPPPDPPDPERRIEEAEAVVAGYAGGPRIKHAAADKCCYSPASDVVLLMPPRQFDSPEDYYATMFHELIHSTGSPSRLARPKDDRAFEELVAELGAAYLSGWCGMGGHKLVENSAAYIDSWHKKLGRDKRLFMKAASAAQKAAALILGDASRPLEVAS
jgi:antirestriction protein ArdC